MLINTEHMLRTLTSSATPRLSINVFWVINGQALGDILIAEGNSLAPSLNQVKEGGGWGREIPPHESDVVPDVIHRHAKR